MSWRSHSYHLAARQDRLQISPTRPRVLIAHKSNCRIVIMVYDWDDKREACFRMYVQEKKTLEEIKEYFRQELGFAPR